MTEPIDKRAEILRWIEEQEALCAAATPGPWRTCIPSDDENDDAFHPGYADGQRDVQVVNDGGWLADVSGRRCAEYPDHHYPASCKLHGEHVCLLMGEIRAEQTANANLIAASRSVLPLALAALKAEVERHSRWGIYDDCGHRHSDEDTDSLACEIDGVGWVCEEGLVQAICRECHTDDGEAREDSDEGEWPCPTIERIFSSLSLQQR